MSHEMTDQEFIRHLYRLSIDRNAVIQGTPMVPIAQTTLRRIINMLGENPTFQEKANRWAKNTFISPESMEPMTRAYRFLEEALELCQAFGMSKDDALKLVDYVYGRPQGDPAQEVGGVLVTLAVLCSVHNLSTIECGDTELRRINTVEMIAKIRDKDANKPLQSGPLPGLGKL